MYRFSSDLADLNLPKTCQMDFPDPDDLLNFRLVIMPDEVDNHVPNFVTFLEVGSIQWIPICCCLSLTLVLV